MTDTTHTIMPLKQLKRLCLDAMQEGQKLPDTLPAGTIPFIYYVCMLGD